MDTKHLHTLGIPLTKAGARTGKELRVVVGADLIRPSIKLNGEIGWDRFGAVLPAKHLRLGALKKQSFFGVLTFKPRRSFTME